MHSILTISEMSGSRQPAPTYLQPIHSKWKHHEPSPLYSSALVICNFSHLREELEKAVCYA